MEIGSMKINVTGTVQGVGFRPFIYRLAVEHSLRGYVKNLGNNVEIIIEGEGDAIESFLEDIVVKKPPLSFIDRIETNTVPVAGFTDFSILSSEKGAVANSIIPPDTAICPDCLGEMLDESNRRYHYPFTVCTNCGPRYTTVRTLPYDRENTTMIDFPLCNECNQEYTVPSDRRYHAQPVCCSKCGPELVLMDSCGVELARGYDAVVKTAELIDSGGIVAVKGYGGFHLACSTGSDEAVQNLRDRLKRPAQPFAVMSKDIETVRSFASVSAKEKDLLSSNRRPIVVLDKNDDFPLSYHVAPGMHNIGVMLPYTGTQHLLLDRSEVATYVMTSANLSGRPMVVDNEEAFLRLNGIADHYLLHNRLIANRTDDTVVRVVDGNTAFIRRSRGFVPEPIRLPFEVEPTIGFGPELNTTVTIARGDHAYLSQYVGNTKHVETARYHREVVRHLRQLTGIEPEHWGCDLHPGFNTTHLALEMGGDDTVFVQHHHAHIVSLMADNHLPLDSKVIGIALDGVGLGDDGTVWGGEVLEATYFGYRRQAGLMPQPMPGGDLAAYYPGRMVLGILNNVLGRDELERLPLIFKHGESERAAILKQLEKGVNVVQSSSTGRVLAASSALLGVSGYRSFEGEPAMKLESAAKKGRNIVDLPVICKHGLLDTSQLLYGVYEQLGKRSVHDLAYATEDAVARGVAELGISVAKKRGIDIIGLSGGVAYNEHIVGRISEVVLDAGLEFIVHRNLPCGDGGVSLGQAIVAGVKARAEF
ncbi:MAG: carbamoyltransferase HypF [Methanosarcinaceae archaeon]|nr:carbamoyltransferase HypF [Methanosarcinaceae archaeon]